MKEVNHVVAIEDYSGTVFFYFNVPKEDAVKRFLEKSHVAPEYLDKRIREIDFTDEFHIPKQ